MVPFAEDDRMFEAFEYCFIFDSIFFGYSSIMKMCVFYKQQLYAFS